MAEEVKRVVVSAEAVAQALTKVDGFMARSEVMGQRQLELLEDLMKELEAVNAILFEMRKDTQRTSDTSKLIARAITDVRTFLGMYKKMTRTAFGQALVYLSGLAHGSSSSGKFKDRQTRSAREVAAVPREGEAQPLTATVGERIESKH